MSRLVIEFSADLLRALQPPAQPAFAAVLRSDRPESEVQLHVGEGLDLEVYVRVEGVRGVPVLCMVDVRVNIPSRGGWPHLAGTEVILKRPNREPETQQTDAFGRAVFEDIPVAELPGLVLEIGPQG